MINFDIIAFDKESVRTKDDDGRLHISVANISKANVCPYLGEEIPGWQELGLEQRKIYKLFRDPKELEVAASTFNNIPLLSEHQPVTVDNHRPELVVGSTGTDATFVDPYLRNSLVIWAAGAIKGIENRRQQELSSAYRYTPVMIPGVWNSQRYDGRMTQIRGNHVALVAVGRAGPDVVVGDAQLEVEGMSKMALSPMAGLVKGAIMVALPNLAKDAAFGTALSGMTPENFSSRKTAILLAAKSLAADADIGKLTELLDGLEKAGSEKPKENVPSDGEEDLPPKEESLTQQLLSKLEELINMVKQGMGGKTTEAVPPADDELPTVPPKEEDKKPLDKTAMDAAIQAAIQRTKNELRAVAEAVDVVRPEVGRLNIAADSATEVYSAALRTMGVKHEGISDVVALKALFSAHAELRRSPRHDAPPAMDSVEEDDFNKLYPGFAAIKL